LIIHPPDPSLVVRSKWDIRVNWTIQPKNITDDARWKAAFRNIL